MGITINIDLDPTRGDLGEQLADALSALGFERKSPTRREGANIHGIGPNMDGGPNPHYVETATEAEPEPTTIRVDEEHSFVEATVPARRRGEPSPGRKRRTKEEIAEDEAAERAETTQPAQISTGGERLGPEDASDSEDIAKQDAADEAAEVEAHRDPQKPLTLDDLRLVVGEYNKKVGLAVSAKQVPIILGCKMTEVPDTQEALAEAIAKVRLAVGLAEAAEKPGETVTVPAVTSATHKDVENAIMAYAAAYGNDAAKADRQAILVKALGPTPTGMKNSKGEPVDFWTVPNIPADKLGVAVRYYKAALTENPFGRPQLNG